jgi:hypothetical protein
MNKLFKTFSIVVLIMIMAVAFFQAHQVSAAHVSIPYGLTMQDTKASVEQKLGQPMVTFAPQAGWELGLPDEGGSPDHIHYWAIYKRFGVTVIYNSPSATDMDATIRTILVNK